MQICQVTHLKGNGLHLSYGVFFEIESIIVLENKNFFILHSCVVQVCRTVIEKWTFEKINMEWRWFDCTVVVLLTMTQVVDVQITHLKIISYDK